MKKLHCLLLALLLYGCAAVPIPQTTAPAETVPETTAPHPTVAETTVPPTTAPLHSEFYMESCTLDDFLTYWDEVVLQMEYTDGTGSPSLVQKWLSPLRCRVYGTPTEEDLTVLEDLFTGLNEIEAFPGIGFAAEDEPENISLSFLDPEQFTEEFSDAVNGEEAWGATQFWYYTESNELHTARIGIRTDIPQSDRSSIIPEEIINSLGISDSILRPDSIVYQFSNENLSLSDVDWLILKLLYHPDIHCGMSMEDCHRVLSELYH